MSFLTDTALSHKKAMRPQKIEIWGTVKKFSALTRRPIPQPHDQVSTYGDRVGLGYWRGFT